MEVKMKVKWKWEDGHWWVHFTGTLKMTPGPNGGFAECSMWLRYDDLCEAFPGFKELATPLHPERS
jgi:hypothetical protein